MPGKNNWAKLTFDGLPARKLGESFEITYTQTTSRNISFTEACRESAHEIFDTYNQKVYISMSGGADSECVANSFYNSGLPFTPIIVKLGQDNHYDIRHALKWCNDRNVTPVIVEYDFDAWCLQLLDIQRRLKNRMFWGLHNVWLGDYVKQLGGYLVNGCGDLQLIPDPSLQKDYPELNDTHAGKFVQWECDYALDQHDPGYHPNGFFMWKPELLVSFINERDPDWSNEEAKWNIYNVPPRPKFVGLEFKSIHVDHHYGHQLKNATTLFGKHDYIIAGTKHDILNALVDPTK